LTDTAELDALESREGGGGWSAKVGARGDCRREEGRERTAGGLFLGEGSTAESVGVSLLATTEAFKRLYKLLKPPWTNSIVFASLDDAGKGGAVRSSKVVKALERDAVACKTWRAS
jgi:hypothetical protein